MPQEGPGQNHHLQPVDIEVESTRKWQNSSNSRYHYDQDMSLSVSRCQTLKAFTASPSSDSSHLGHTDCTVNRHFVRVQWLSFIVIVATVVNCLTYMSELQVHWKIGR